MNAWYTDKDGTRHCKTCGASAFTVDAGCKCPDDPAEPPGSQFGSESMRVDSGSAGSAPVVEWVADEYRQRLIESDTKLEALAAQAEEEVGDARVATFESTESRCAAVNALLKTAGALREMQRKTRSALYRSAVDRETRQAAEMNKRTAAELKRLQGGRH